MIHIWWGCPRVKEFGGKIHSEIVSLLNLPLKFLPGNCLLHLDFKLSTYDTVLMNNLLVLIAKKWRTEEVPTIHEWRAKCQFLLLMNKLTTIKRARKFALYEFYST